MSDGVTICLKLVGLPDLAASLGGSEQQVRINGDTVGDLLQWLQKTHGDSARTRVVDRAGLLDQDIVLLHNDREPIPHDSLGYQLTDGDQLTLAVVLAGG